jgi:hypothetical protein
MSQKKSYETKIQKLLGKYSLVNEQEIPITLNPSVLENIMAMALDISSATELFINADDSTLDPIYRTVDGYREMLSDKLNRISTELAEILGNIGVE